MSTFNTDQQKRIIALEEAICPRVAARLTALEKRALAQDIYGDAARVMIQPPNNPLPWKGLEALGRVPERSVGRAPELGMAYTPGHPVSAFERMKRAQKVRDIAREVLGDNHSYKGTFGDIEVVVRRK